MRKCSLLLVAVLAAVPLWECRAQVIATPVLQTAPIDPRAYGLVVGTGLSSGVRQANRVALTNAVAAAVASTGRRVQLPKGTIEIEYGDEQTVAITGSVWIDGHGKGITHLDVYPKTLTSGYAFDAFRVTVTGNYNIRVSNMSADGPDVTVEDSPTRFVDWVHAGTQGSVLELENLTTTGLWTNSINRSGGGVMRMRDCEFTGWTAAVGFFESLDVSSSPNNAVLYMQNCKLNGTGGSSTNVGLYIHPHIPFHITGTLFEDFARYGVYQNGTTVNVADYALIDSCAFIDTRGLQTKSHVQVGTSKFLRGGRGGGTTNPNSGVTYTNCEFVTHPVVSVSDVVKRCTFNACHFYPTAAASVEMSGTGAEVWNFNGCKWFITGTGSVILTGSTFTAGKVFFTDCFVDHQEAGASTLFDVKYGEFWIKNLTIINARVHGIWANGSGASSTLHIDGLDYHASVSTRPFVTSGNTTPNRLDGRNITLRGSVSAIINDTGSIQQRLVRTRGVNPTAVASAATINTHGIAWTNYDTHVITGSTDIATLAEPWPFAGEIRLVAAASSNWATLNSGNITPITTSKRTVGSVVTLLWEPTAAKWLEVGPP